MARLCGILARLHHIQSIAKYYKSTMGLVHWYQVEVSTIISRVGGFGVPKEVF